MSVNEIMNSGLLESYVIGQISKEDTQLIEKAMVNYPEILNEIRAIEIALEKFAIENAVEPDATVFPMLLATKDYTERLQNGEPVSDVPFLTMESKVSDFSEWLDRDDMQEPKEYNSMHGIILAATEEKTSLIIWLKEGAPDETHTDKHEKFLIIEGTCNITIGDKVHSLKPGDFLEIPLHINHRVEVTSDMPCKILLERKAA